MKSKSYKTTLVGVFGMILMIIAMLLVYFEKATLTDVGTFGGVLSPILLAIATYFAKDSSVKSLDDETAKKVTEYFKKK